MLCENYSNWMIKYNNSFSNREIKAAVLEETAAGSYVSFIVEYVKRLINLFFLIKSPFK